MKYLKKLIPFLLVLAGTAPQLANATAINVGRPYEYRYVRMNDPRTVIRSSSVKYCCGKEIANVNSVNLLSPSANANLNLAKGNYQFGQLESSFNQRFSELWTFSLAGTPSSRAR